MLSDTRSALAKHSISVALCTFNGERYLGEQLQSIANQSILPSELVVCDDASSDSTLSILEAFARVSPFPVRIFQNEQRLGSTRNFEKAIRLCEAEIIALSDQDDVWYPHKLERIWKAMASGADLAFSDAEVVDANLSPLGYRLWETILFGRREQRHVEDGYCFDVLLRRNVVTGATMAFRSRLRGGVLPIPETWVHDGWIALHMAAIGRVIKINESLIAYRQHNANQVGANRYSHFSQVKHVTDSRIEHHVRLVTQYHEALQHLRNVSAVMHVNDRYLENLEMKVGHNQIRLAVRQGVTAVGLTDMFKELVAGRYHRYGNGYLSFMKDLVIFNRRSLRRFSKIV